MLLGFKLKVFRKLSIPIMQSMPLTTAILSMRTPDLENTRQYDGRQASRQLRHGHMPALEAQMDYPVFGLCTLTHISATL